MSEKDQNQQFVDVQDDEDQNELGFDSQIRQQLSNFVLQPCSVILPNQKISKLLFSENSNVVTTESNRFYRKRIKDKSYIQYELPDTNAQNFMGFMMMGNTKPTIKNMYMDLYGNHCFITTSANYTFYFNIRHNKIKIVQKLKNLNVTALAFYDPPNQIDSGDIIVAHDQAKLALLRVSVKQQQIIEQYSELFQLTPSSEVNSIKIFNKLMQNPNVGGRYLIILYMTKSSIFCMTGPDDIGLLLDKFKDKIQKVKQIYLPKGYTSMGHTCYSKITKRPTAYIWSNGVNIVLFKIPQKHEKITDNFMVNSEFYKFAKREDGEDINSQRPIINIAITEFHYYLLHQDTLTVISRITQSVVKYFQFSDIANFFYERLTNKLWIYGKSSLYCVDITREGTDVWKLLIQKKKFKEAYQIAKYDKYDMQYVAGLYADDLFQKKQYQLAAVLYADTSLTFEQIMIKFFTMDCEQSRDGLETYLKTWLKKLKGEQKSQRCLLVTWLVELIVFKLNNLEKESKRSPKLLQQIKNSIKLKEQELDKLLFQNIDALNQNAIYKIMQSHGRVNNMIRFAQKKNNLEVIIMQNITDQNYKLGIQYLKKVKGSKTIDIVQNYSRVFFREEPEETVDLLVKYIQDFKPGKVIQGIMNIPAEKRICGVNIMKHIINQQKNRDRLYMNTLIYFYTNMKTQNKDQLITLIKSKIHFDLQFALRQFRRNKFLEGQIIIYGIMNLYAESVRLALLYKRLDLAQTYANMPPQEQDKKKLWLQIAKSQLSLTKNAKQVIRFMKKSKVVKIQDLLPYLSIETRIDDFKDQICEALKTYATQIDSLKKSMDTYSKNAEKLKRELSQIKAKAVDIDQNVHCEDCFRPAYNKEYYYFLCGHAIHKECLIEHIICNRVYDRQTTEKIISLDKQYKELKINLQKSQLAQKEVSPGFSLNVFNYFTTSEDLHKSISVHKEEIELQDKKDQLNEILSQECIFCGPSVVDIVTMPYDQQTYKNNWKL